MKDRGKAVETFNANCFSDYYSTSDLPCKKHPSSSSVGICAYCLKDRLIKLVCSDCGEQRLSSCSCSEVSYPNSCTVEVGSVGRVSFLIENERTETSRSNSKPRSEDRSEKFVLLKRSNSSCVEIKRSTGFWSIGRLFRKKRDRGFERNVGGFDEKSEMWMFDNYMGVSRSRSLCSFRGGGLNGSEEGGDLTLSGARNSAVTGGLVLDSEKQVGFNEAEPRKSSFNGVLDSENGFDFKGVKKGVGFLELDPDINGANRSVFSVKETDFNGVDDSGFIDLKLDLSTDSKPEFSALKMGDLSAVSDLESGFTTSLRDGTLLGHHECGGSFGSLIGDGISRNGSSCRITVNDRGIKKSRKGHKVWRWIFRHNPSWRSARKKDEDHILKL